MAKRLDPVVFAGAGLEAGWVAMLQLLVQPMLRHELGNPVHRESQGYDISRISRQIKE